MRRAPLKDLGIVAVEASWFKRQCDCFVTKRLSKIISELKEFTKFCERGQSDSHKEARNAQKAQKALKTGVVSTHNPFCGSCGFCAFSWFSCRYKLTTKSRVRANVMGHKTPDNQDVNKLYDLIRVAMSWGFRDSLVPSGRVVQTNRDDLL